MIKLLRDGLAAEMIDSACKLVVENGISTRNKELLDSARSNDNLNVKGQRIFPSPEIIQSCLSKAKATMVPRGAGVAQLHDCRDMVINRGDDHDIVIKLTDLPYQYCDHKAGKIVPLTRDQVISGTKLLHVLSQNMNIKGYSCGVPQDVHPFLKPLEQYIIGFRYNQNGGGTIQQIAPEIEQDFFEIRRIAEGIENRNLRDIMLFSPSPMVLDAQDLYLCFQKNFRPNSFLVGSMPMMGMTGPVDPVGVYILALAEVIGSAGILHAIFPDAGMFLYPHPQAMSLQTGQMAFGTIEHARLEMLKMEIMNELGLQYYNLKDIMTSAQMPGPMAQGDKALGFFTGIMAGYRAFNLMPLSTDQVWSPVQTLLDIENLENAWKSIAREKVKGNCKNSEAMITEVLMDGGLFAEHNHTLIDMLNNYETCQWQQRYFTSESWADAGTPDELPAIEEKTQEMSLSWDYRPPNETLEEIIIIYRSLCRKFNQEPLNLD